MHTSLQSMIILKYNPWNLCDKCKISKYSSSNSPQASIPFFSSYFLYSSSIIRLLIPNKQVNKHSIFIVELLAGAIMKYLTTVWRECQSIRTATRSLRNGASQEQRDPRGRCRQLNTSSGRGRFLRVCVFCSSEKK